MVSVIIKEVKERSRSFISKANVDNSGDKIYLTLKDKSKTYTSPSDLAEDIKSAIGAVGDVWQYGIDRTDLVGQVEV